MNSFFDCYDKSGELRVVEIFHVDENLVTIKIDEVNKVSINPNIFKQREQLRNQLILENFCEDDIQSIMISIFIHDEFEDPISLSLLDETSKNKARKFKSDDD